MNFETWLLFCSASLVVILIPGPLSLLMISNSLNYGIRRSAPAFVGGVSASLCLLIASASGLGALLVAAEDLFTLIRYLGAAYLIYLGWRSWVEASQAKGLGVDTEPETRQRPRFGPLYWRAFSLGISNPKDLLFFIAFLPQFIDPQAAMAQQLLVMTLSWCVLDLFSKLVYGFGGCPRRSLRHYEKDAICGCSTASAADCLSVPAVRCF